MQASNLRPVVRIVDDEPQVLASESFLVTMAGFQTATYNSAEEFLKNYDPLFPGCLILDIRMPGLNGLQLQEEMIAREVDLPIIFLTGHGDVDMAVKALLTGATDFIIKPPAPERLSKSIQKAIDKNIKDRTEKEKFRVATKKYETLTESEKKVAIAIAQGLPNKTIAYDNGVSEQAVKNWRSSIFNKLDCRHAIDLNNFLRDIGKIKGGK